MGKSLLEKEFERLSKGAKSQSDFDKAYLKALEATKKPYEPRSPAGRQYKRRLERIGDFGEHEQDRLVRDSEAGMEEPRIPNLDRMSEDKLMDFWARYHRPTKKTINELFPGWPQRGLRKTVSALANYASNKAAEKASWRRQDRTATNIYKKTAAMVYDDLPDYARFKG